MDSLGKNPGGVGYFLLKMVMLDSFLKSDGKWKWWEPLKCCYGE